MKWRDFAEFMLLAAVWGASFLFMRVAAPQFGVFPLMGLRAVIGALILLPLVMGAGGAAELRANAGRIAWVGLLSAGLPFVLLGYALQYQAAGFTAILNSTTPFWGAIVAYLWLGERLGVVRSVGMAIGFGGMLVLIWGRVSFAADGLGLPILATLFAYVSYGLASCATRVQLGGVRPLTAAAGSQVFAALLLAPFAIAWWPAQPPDGRAWLSAALLGALSTGLAYLLFFRLIARIGSTRTMSVSFLIPVFGVLWGALFLGEAVTARMLVGAATILAGTALATGLVDPRRWFAPPDTTADAPGEPGARS